MYIGQMLCFGVYWIFYFCRPSSLEANWVPISKWFLFLPATLINMIGLTTIYVGLNLTYQTSYQMLRGTIVVFTGLLSVAFLGRTIRVYMWVGITVLTVGLIAVGLADPLLPPGVQEDANGIVSGSLLVILADIILAVQFVYEEKFLKKHNVSASLAAGLEGLFGSIILGILIVPMDYIPASKPFTLNPYHLEDVHGAFMQMRDNWRIVAATVGLIISSAFLGYCGIKVTKEMSATSRQVLDSTRLLIVWIVALAVKWDKFNKWVFLLQFAGYILVIVGVIIYLDFIFRPYLIRHHIIKKTKKSRREGEEGNEMTVSAGDDYDEDDSDTGRLIRARE
jgi:drug/metabolite transporter (DMT)-like permease